MIDEQTGEIMLSDPERAELVELEAVIQRGIQQFVNVGNALMQIRDRGLYRADYPTFEQYCAERWQLGRAHAYRLMDAAHVVALLSPNGDMTPINEAQARELAKLDGEAVRLAWQVVIQTAPAGKVTAAHVKSVVEVMREVMTTGAIDDGDGGQIAVSDALKAAITEETYERMMRQQQHIAERSEPPFTGRAICNETGLWLETDQAVPFGEYRVTLRRTS